MTLTRAFRRKNRVDLLRRSIDKEALALEGELSHLELFLQRAPRMQEEARNLIPSPDQFVPDLPDAPNRSAMRQVQCQIYAQLIRFIVLLALLGASVWWFVRRVENFLY